MYNPRIKNLQEILTKKNLDALLVSNFYNIIYLTGFQTLSPKEREAFVLVTKNYISLFTDGRYLSNIKDQKSNIKNEKIKIHYRLIEPRKSIVQHLSEIIQKEKISKLGFEAEDLSFFEYKKLNQGLKSIQLVPLERSVIKNREIKEQKEIEKIKKACEIGDQCLDQIIRLVKPGMTEKEIAFKIEFWLKEKGFDLAFDPIVAFHKNSSVPHYVTKTGEARIKSGSLILVDFGVKYQDYVSDITRMFFFGRPERKVLKIYEQLLSIQENTLQKVKNTNDPKEVDQFCRKLINDQFLPIFPHSTGHGVGLEIHEYPKISSVSQDALQTNQVFSIEPGVYFPGEFGIRIEDLVWKKENSIEILTKFSKRPYIL